jgi:hypothetical protein
VAPPRFRYTIEPIESLDHIHVLADPELGCTPRRYPDPDRGARGRQRLARPPRLARARRRAGREAAAVARDISRAASYFLLNQLPELYGGLQRDPTNFPVQYLGANVPQAWAAGTPFMLLQAMLGLQQDGPRGKLYVDPALPDWLPDVTLKDLRLGRRRFDIRFWRDGERTEFEVLKGKPDAVARISMAVQGGVARE